MSWDDLVKTTINSIKPVSITPEITGQLIGLLDFTSLNENDTEESIANFIQKANTSYGPVAAVCLYPRFVSLAATEFAYSSIKIATVANFPSGDKALSDVLVEINDAIEDGAEEIDVVFPYQDYLTKKEIYAYEFILACKAACNDVLLKVILETGALKTFDHIAKASEIALNAGADFIKTSTGKTHGGATLEAATVMLLVIKRLTSELKRTLGFKASGGIRTIEEAMQYIALAEKIMGAGWVSSATFRIGTSKLLEEIK